MTLSHVTKRNSSWADATSQTFPFRCCFWSPLRSSLNEFPSHSFTPPAQYQDVHKIMSDETMSDLFGQWVEKCLCGESYWFLREVSEILRNSGARGLCLRPGA